MFSIVQAAKEPFIDKNMAFHQDSLPQQVIITYNKGNPPLKFIDDNGEASGILLDIWRLWAEKTGIEVAFKEALFSDTIRCGI